MKKGYEYKLTVMKNGKQFWTWRTNDKKNAKDVFDEFKAGAPANIRNQLTYTIKEVPKPKGGIDPEFRKDVSKLKKKITEIFK